MYGMQFGLALAAVVCLGDSLMLRPSFGFQPIAVAEAPADSMRLTAPAPWLRADPADSLYRAAREALNRRDYRAAATLFAQIPARFPKSGYAADALYWQAFALYRLGGDRELRLARDALRRQRDRFPKAATNGDAAALEQRIQGELARRGDPVATAEVTAAATAASAERRLCALSLEISSPLAWGANRPASICAASGQFVRTKSTSERRVASGMSSRAA